MMIPKLAAAFVVGGIAVGTVIWLARPKPEIIPPQVAVAVQPAPIVEAPSLPEPPVAAPPPAPRPKPKREVPLRHHRCPQYRRSRRALRFQHRHPRPHR